MSDLPDCCQNAVQNTWSKWSLWGGGGPSCSCIDGYVFKGCNKQQSNFPVEVQDNSLFGQPESDFSSLGTCINETDYASIKDKNSVLSWCREPCSFCCINPLVKSDVVTVVSKTMQLLHPATTSNGEQDCQCTNDAKSQCRDVISKRSSRIAFKYNQGYRILDTVQDIDFISRPTTDKNCLCGCYDSKKFTFSQYNANGSIYDDSGNINLDAKEKQSWEVPGYKLDNTCKNFYSLPENGGYPADSIFWDEEICACVGRKELWHRRCCEYYDAKQCRFTCTVFKDEDDCKGDLQLYAEVRVGPEEGYNSAITKGKSTNKYFTGDGCDKLPVCTTKSCTTTTTTTTSTTTTTTTICPVLKLNDADGGTEHSPLFVNIVPGRNGECVYTMKCYTCKQCSERDINNLTPTTLKIRYAKNGTSCSDIKSADNTIYLSSCATEVSDIEFQNSFCNPTTLPPDPCDTTKQEFDRCYPNYVQNMKQFITSLGYKIRSGPGIIGDIILQRPILFPSGSPCSDYYDIIYYSCDPANGLDSPPEVSGNNILTPELSENGQFNYSFNDAYQIIKPANCPEAPNDMNIPACLKPRPTTTTPCPSVTFNNSQLTGFFDIPTQECLYTITCYECSECPQGRSVSVNAERINSKSCSDFTATDTGKSYVSNCSQCPTTTTTTPCPVVIFNNSPVPGSFDDVKQQCLYTITCYQCGECPYGRTFERSAEILDFRSCKDFAADNTKQPYVADCSECA